MGGGLLEGVTDSQTPKNGSFAWRQWVIRSGPIFVCMGDDFLKSGRGVRSKSI